MEGSTQFLLCVVVVLSLLSPSFSQLRADQQQADLKHLQEKLEFFKEQRGKFPPSSASFKEPPPIPQFNCPALPPAEPTDDVNKLKPGNIKVTMAVGDSISAGFAMKAGHFWDVSGLVEFRGSVFSIGGDANELTIPNFLRHYNPDIVGPSVNYTLPLDVVEWKDHLIQPWDPPITKLNGAQSSAKIEDVPAQIEYIVEQIHTTFKDQIDIQNDWKLLTIFIGANNICPSCRNSSNSQPDFYEDYLNNILVKVSSQLPRTFVNIVNLFNISQVYDIAMKDAYCILMWDTLCRSECGCLTDNSTQADRDAMDRTSVAFNDVIFKVVDEWRARNLPGFTVRAQPFIKDLVIPPEIGIYYLSELDCFHPSLYADQAFAIGLWNNMLTSDKQTALDPNNIQITCPTADTYLQ